MTKIQVQHKETMAEMERMAKSERESYLMTISSQVNLCFFEIAL